MSAYPVPTNDGWEDAYRYAYAKDEVYAKLFTAVSNWGKEFDAIVKKEDGGEKDIIEA